MNSLMAMSIARWLSLWSFETARMLQAISGFFLREAMKGTLSSMMNQIGLKSFFCYSFLWIIDFSLAKIMRGRHREV